MSLKAFHIVFILLSVLLCVGFGFWEFSRFAGEGSVLHLIGGIAALGAGAGLVLYGIRFLRKLRNVSYI